MARKSKPAAPSAKPGQGPAQPKVTPKPSRTPAHLPGQPGRGGFDKTVKKVPLPGKHRGR